MRKTARAGRGGWPVLLGVVAGCGLVGLALAAGKAAAQAQPGFSGKLEVRQIELGYRIGSGSMKVRVHLASGQALDYDTKDATEVERIVQITHVFTSGRAKLFAEMYRNELVALDLSVP